MTASDLITPAHLHKKAVIYVRQSTLTQVINNQESLRLQYALQQRAQDLGWRAEDIEVIDADLGLTGAFAQHRSGFPRTGDESDPRASRHHSLLRCHAPLAQLLRLVSAAGCLWLPRMPHRRSRWGLRSRLDQRSLDSSA